MTSDAFENELTEIARAAYERGAETARNLARVVAMTAGYTAGFRSVCRPEDEGRLPYAEAWSAAHAEAPWRDRAAAVPDVDPQGRPGYYLADPLTSDLGSVQWPVIRVQDPGESECIGYVIRRRDDFGAYSLHGYLGTTRDRHNALIMVAHRDDRETVRKVSGSLALGAREIDDEGDTVWPILRRGERVGTIREVRGDRGRYYTVYVRGRERSGPFETLDEAAIAVKAGERT